MNDPNRERRRAQLAELQLAFKIAVAQAFLRKCC
jgi:hypothetical protein